jgi:hypothetical protein
MFLELCFSTRGIGRAARACLKLSETDESD